MLTYTLVALFLTYLSMAACLGGRSLWHGVALRAVMAVPLIVALRAEFSAAMRTLRVVGRVESMG